MNAELTDEQLAQVEKQVYETFPIRPGEKLNTWCAQRKRSMNDARDRLRKLLITKLKEKVEFRSS